MPGNSSPGGRSKLHRQIKARVLPKYPTGIAEFYWKPAQRESDPLPGVSRRAAVTILLAAL